MDIAKLILNDVIGLTEDMIELFDSSCVKILGKLVALYVVY